MNNDKLDKKKVIKEIYTTLRKHLPEKEHLIFKSYQLACLECIENNDDLQKPLVNLFFIALHYPYASFDMIACDDNGEPLLIEVKTTKNSRQQNDSFRISSGEIQKAMANENYLIARVTKDKITFIQNPIKPIADKIKSIEGDDFKIKPTGYIFEFNNNKELS
jgi:arginine utilization protein RocB